MHSVKIKYQFLILIFIFIFFSQAIVAQHQVHKRALRFQELALVHFRQGDTTNAREFAIKAIAKDNLYATPWVLLGNIYEMQSQNQRALQAYHQARNLDSINFPDLLYVVGELEMKLRIYNDAILHFSDYLSKNSKAGRKRNIAEHSLELAKFRKLAYENPVEFKPISLGNQINSANDEYFNSMSIDQQSIYITIKKMIGTDEQHNPIFNEGLYMFSHDDTSWTQPKSLTFDNEPISGIGAASVSPNNRYLFFTACHMDDGEGSCDLYYAKIEGDKLGEARNLGRIVNSSAWDSQPCFSTDGRTLFFASKRSGGFGGSDIWTSQLDENGNFQTPQNLGSVINTSADEMSPFIHADAKSLYFASTGHHGLGGFDLFRSRKSESNDWSKPKNLGYPINTEKDEITLSVSADGIAAYISSDQLEGEGGFDIYQFELNDSMRADPVSYVEGRVFDAETDEALVADIDLVELSTKQQFTYTQSELNTGKFLVALPMQKMFAFNISKPGYLFFSEHFPIREQNTKFNPVFINIPLTPIKKGETIILKNLFFDTDQYQLKETSYPELSKLILFLENNPKLKVEISGHTDNVGSREYNQELSDKRAQSIFNYLQQEGIENDRLQFKGLGFDEPIDSNETEEGRANNRRTEVKILSIN